MCSGYVSPVTTTATTEAPAGSLRSGWRVLLAEPDRVLVPTGVLVLCGTVLQVLGQYAISETVATSRHCTRLYLGQPVPVDCGPSNARAQLALVLGVVVLVTIAHLVVAGIYRVALGGRACGRQVVGRVVATSLLVAVLITVSAAFLLVPALVVGFLTRYALLFVLDQEQSPWAAVVSSARLVTSRLRSELGFVLRAGALLIAATLLLGVGLVVAVPVVLVAQVQRYQVDADGRRITRGG